jgi:hypothetical protein
VEDLSTDDIKQLLNFYKQKSSELEFQVLQMQIKLNKLSKQEESIPAIKTTKTK